MTLLSTLEVLTLLSFEDSIFSAIVRKMLSICSPVFADASTNGISSDVANA
jgi:hypothetical protein